MSSGWQEGEKHRGSMPGVVMLQEVSVLDTPDMPMISPPLRVGWP
jgi:hypothetical protein